MSLKAFPISIAFIITILLVSIHASPPADQAPAPPQARNAGALPQPFEGQGALGTMAVSPAVMSG